MSEKNDMEIAIAIKILKIGWNWIIAGFKKKSFNEIKASSSILFIDDEQLSIVRLLKRDSWNVRQIKNTPTLDDPEIVRSNVIFIDVVGIGEDLSKENKGAELAKLLKNKYSKKYIIISSNYVQLRSPQEFSHDWIQKNAPISDFVNIIEKGIKFSGI